jgi:hypothetical protein
MASDATKYQINFKTHKDGTLINLYADSIKELETQITDMGAISLCLNDFFENAWLFFSFNSATLGLIWKKFTLLLSPP